MQRSGLWTLALAASTAGLMTASLPSNAQELESRVLELEQELRLMKTQLTSQVKQAQEAAAKAGEAGDKYKMKGPTPKWESADGRFKMEIDGRIHYDFGLFSQDDAPTGNVEFPDLNSGSNFRRGRIGVKGVIDK